MGAGEELLEPEPETGNFPYGLILIFSVFFLIFVVIYLINWIMEAEAKRIVSRVKVMVMVFVLLIAMGAILYNFYLLLDLPMSQDMRESKVKVNLMHRDEDRVSI